jgi:hypothetical protein
VEGKFGGFVPVVAFPEDLLQTQNTSQEMKG